MFNTASTLNSIAGALQAPSLYYSSAVGRRRREKAAGARSLGWKKNRNQLSPNFFKFCGVPSARLAHLTLKTPPVVVPQVPEGGWASADAPLSKAVRRRQTDDGHGILLEPSLLARCCRVGAPTLRKRAGEIERSLSAISLQAWASQLYTHRAHDNTVTRHTASQGPGRHHECATCYHRQRNGEGSSTGAERKKTYKHRTRPGRVARPGPSR